MLQAGAQVQAIVVNAGIRVFHALTIEYNVFHVEGYQPKLTQPFGIWLPDIIFNSLVFLIEDLFSRLPNLPLFLSG